MHAPTMPSNRKGHMGKALVERQKATHCKHSVTSKADNRFWPLGSCKKGVGQAWTNLATRIGCAATKFRFSPSCLQICADSIVD